MTELEEYINSYFEIEKKYLNNLTELFTVTTLSKDDYFSEIGKSCLMLSFVKNGYLRVYNYSDGKDITQWISSKGEFITDLSSLLFNTPARWNIQALTDCELYTINKENYKKIGELISEWDKLEKLFIAKCFLALEDRVYSFLSMSAEERFNMLFKSKSELFNQVPLHFIASMLGMTPETLSRIRRKIFLDLYQDNFNS